jgi:hypothetical protein
MVYEVGIAGPGPSHKIDAEMIDRNGDAMKYMIMTFGDWSG